MSHLPTRDRFPGPGFVSFPDAPRAAAAAAGALERTATALEPGHRDQPQRDLRRRPRRRPPHAPTTDRRIIIAASVAATMVQTVIGSAYLAAKAGADTSCTPVALELATSGSRRQRDRAGGLREQASAAAARWTPTCRRALASVTPMRRVGQPDDVKALALFLAAPTSGSSPAGNRHRQRHDVGVVDDGLTTAQGGGRQG